jgi:hypothetical protein
MIVSSFRITKNGTRITLNEALELAWPKLTRIGLCVQIDLVAPLKNINDHYLNLSINHIKFEGEDSSEQQLLLSTNSNACEFTNYFTQ